MACCSSQSFAFEPNVLQHVRFRKTEKELLELLKFNMSGIIDVYMYIDVSTFVEDYL